MALRYVIKKRTFGFDKTKAEKYVAQNVITNTLDFRDLCEEITKVGMVPSGAVKFVLDAFGLEYLQTIAFILVIAALVQMVEIILKKVSPALYQALGVFLPLITTNCCILGVAILVIQKDFDLLTGVVYAFSTALGFALAMVLFAGIREQLSLVNIPKGMQGMAIALVTAGLLAMAFMGFSGVDKGLGVLFGIE